MNELSFNLLKLNTSNIKVNISSRLTERDYFVNPHDHIAIERLRLAIIEKGVVLSQIVMEIDGKVYIECDSFHNLGTELVQEIMRESNKRHPPLAYEVKPLPSTSYQWDYHGIISSKLPPMTMFNYQKNTSPLLIISIDSTEVEILKDVRKPYSAILSSFVTSKLRDKSLIVSDVEVGANDVFFHIKNNAYSPPVTLLAPSRLPSGDIDRYIEVDSIYMLEVSGHCPFDNINNDDAILQSDHFDRLDVYGDVITRYSIPFTSCDIYSASDLLKLIDIPEYWISVGLLQYFMKVALLHEMSFKYYDITKSCYFDEANTILEREIKELMELSVSSLVGEVEHPVYIIDMRPGDMEGCFIRNIKGFIFYITPMSNEEYNLLLINGVISPVLVVIDGILKNTGNLRCDF